MTDTQLGEVIQQYTESGVVDAICPTCGEWHSLEIDGSTVCECGTLIKSPILEEVLV